MFLGDFAWGDGVINSRFSRKKISFRQTAIISKCLIKRTIQNAQTHTLSVIQCVINMKSSLLFSAFSYLFCVPKCDVIYWKSIRWRSSWLHWKCLDVFSKQNDMNMKHSSAHSVQLLLISFTIPHFEIQSVFSVDITDRQNAVWQLPIQNFLCPKPDSRDTKLSNDTNLVRLPLW